MKSVLLRILLALFAFTLVWATFAALYVGFRLVARFIGGHDI
jgi:uncharacterized membrane protein